MIVFIYQFYIPSLLWQITFRYSLPVLIVVFEVADFQYTSLTKHQKQYNPY
jgi:hypothetical protein